MDVINFTLSMLLFLLTNGSDFEENLLSKIIKVFKISVSSVAEDYVYSQTYIKWHHV